MELLNTVATAAKHLPVTSLHVLTPSVLKITLNVLSLLVQTMTVGKALIPNVTMILFVGSVSSTRMLLGTAFEGIESTMLLLTIVMKL